MHWHRAGGHVHRDMTPIIRCIRAVVSTKTLLLHLVPTHHHHHPTTTTTTATATAKPPPQNHHHNNHHHNNHYNHHNHHTAVCPQECPFLLRHVSMEASGQPSGAAQRRRQRRLRSWLKHERQSVTMALAEHPTGQNNFLFQLLIRPPWFRIK